MQKIIDVSSGKIESATNLLQIKHLGNQKKSFKKKEKKETQHLSNKFKVKNL
jgi:hypothetical protein